VVADNLALLILARVDRTRAVAALSFSPLSVSLLN
jgi:hypothetical protein